MFHSCAVACLTAVVSLVLHQGIAEGDIGQGSPSQKLAVYGWMHGWREREREDGVCCIHQHWHYVALARILTMSSLKAAPGTRTLAT